MIFRNIRDSEEIERVLFLFRNDIFNKSITEKQLRLLAKKFSEYATFLVVEDKEGIFVGFCAFYANDVLLKVAFISMIIIGKNCQRQGFGKRIMMEVQKQAKEKGMSIVRAEVAITNEKSKLFFTSQNFSISSIEGNSIFFEKRI